MSLGLPCGALHHLVNFCATPFSVPNAVQREAMSDDASIRLEKLRAMFARPIDLRARTGRSASFCSDLLNGRKSFGEKLARDLEDELGLPRGWLDRVDEPSSEADEKALLVAFRSLASDPVAAARALAYVEGLAAASGDSLGGASALGASQSPTQKHAA